MKRRRRIHEPTPTRQWESDREFQMQRCIGVALGIRPEEWWQHESGRPDLAAGAGLDAYGHLLPPEKRERAAERLRFLVGNGLLTDAELHALHAAAHVRPAVLPNFSERRWRLAILTDIRGDQ